MLSPNVIANLMLESLLLLFAFIAFIIAWQIVLKWDKSATTPLQYSLEKRSYLVATIVEFIFWLKLPLFFYFIYTLDVLSNVLPGAMCAAGVTTATAYGIWLFVVKILNLYLFGLWIVLNRIDRSRPDTPWTKQKFLLFLLIFPLFALEVGLEYLHFSGINPHVIVSCCGTLFSAVAHTPVAMAIRLPAALQLSLFYGTFFLVVVAAWKRWSLLAAALNALFLPVAVLSLIAFFSTYIYELPHHHCPFCLLQRDYHYVGYILYAALFLGTFFGIASYVAKRLGYEAWKRWLNWSLIGDTLYLVLVSYYPISFYIKNGVWL